MVMKRFLLIVPALFLLFVLVGCGRYENEVYMNGVNTVDVYELTNNDNEVIACKTDDVLEFASVEDFLAAHRTVRASGDISDLVVESTYLNLPYLVESVKLSELKRLYLPTSIPDKYQLYKILVNERTVGFWYLHEEDLVSENAFLNATVQKREFLFCFVRLDVDNPLEGSLKQGNASKEGLINGKYLFSEPNMFIWAFDRDLLYMYVPLPSRNYQRLASDDSTAKLIEQGNAFELVKFAETDVVDLLDEDAVTTLIRQYQSASQDLEQDVGALDDDEIATNDEGGDVEVAGSDE